MRLCIHGHQLFRLKTLIVHQNCTHFPWHIELNSIDLKTFEFRGFLGTFTFVAVPCLAKVNVWFALFLFLLLLVLIYQWHNLKAICIIINK